MPNQEHEREREIKHIATGTYPQPRGGDYSLLVMESTEMMKMATGEGFPSGRVPERAPESFLVATEACGGGTPDLSCSSMVLGYMGIYRRKKSVGGASRCPRDWRARPGGVGTPPYLVASSTLPWLALQVPGIASVPKITFPKVSFPLDSV